MTTFVGSVYTGETTFAVSEDYSTLAEAMSKFEDPLDVLKFIEERGFALVKLPIRHGKQVTLS
jgi:hypothetical protein